MGTETLWETVTNQGVTVKATVTNGYPPFYMLKAYRKDRCLRVYDSYDGGYLNEMYDTYVKEYTDPEPDPYMPVYQEQTLPQNPSCAKKVPSLSAGVPVRMVFGRVTDPLLGKGPDGKDQLCEARTVEWGNGEGVDLYLRLGDEPIQHIELPWISMEALVGVLNRAMGKTPEETP